MINFFLLSNSEQKWKSDEFLFLTRLNQLQKTPLERLHGLHIKLLISKSQIYPGCWLNALPAGILEKFIE